jgi:probable HAF family extracellular repeat protein
MKSKILTYFIAMTAFGALATPTRLAAQDQEERNNKKQRHYSITNLGTLGGTSSNASGINNKGWVVGDANLAGDTTEHASLWRNGVITDLGTLGGLNSGIGYPARTDARGLITGNTQISTIDPLGENWGLLFFCSPNGGSCQGYQNLVLGFLWQNGAMPPLPTLGGNNAVALGGVNNRGQMVGYAENSTRDRNCAPPQVLDWEAVIWGPKRGEIHELPPFPGDSVGAAAGINDKGQVVGGSGVCGFPSFGVLIHAVLWQNSSVIDLGSFGGVMNNGGLAINNRGQVVGLSDLAGDTTAHAFFWEDGVMTDLGTLPGDVFSMAQGINDAGQVVGQSCDQSGNCRAFVWQDGAMSDLNTLISPGSSSYLLAGEDINSQGEIVGSAFDRSNGETLGFLAIPKRDGDNNEADSSAPNIDGNTASRVVLPENVRKQLQRRRGLGRFSARLTGTQ